MLTRCQHCNTPVFEIRQGMLIVKERHHGEWHTSVYPLQELQKESPPDGPKHFNKQDV